MTKPTLMDLLGKYKSPAQIPKAKLRAAGYKRVVNDGPSSASTVVHIQPIDAPASKPPPAPKTAKHGRVVPNKNWGYRLRWTGRGKVRHHA